MSRFKLSVCECGRTTVNNAPCPNARAGSDSHRLEDSRLSPGFPTQPRPSVKAPVSDPRPPFSGR